MAENKGKEKEKREINSNALTSFLPRLAGTSYSVYTLICQMATQIPHPASYSCDFAVWRLQNRS